MEAFHNVLNMPEYGRIMSYGRALNMPGQCFIGFQISLGGTGAINISSKTEEKETPQGSIVEIFLLGTFKTTS